MMKSNPFTGSSPGRPKRLNAPKITADPSLKSGGTNISSISGIVKMLTKLGKA
jgi:hypothetical protein